MDPTRTLFICVGALLGAGCGADKHSADFLADGPYQVGTHSFVFVDSTRPTPPNGSYAGASSRTLNVSVWYPAGPDANGPTPDASLAKGGPFPLIIHSHGFDDNRMGEHYLGEHLATHGYIVAAPEYPLSSGSAPGGATLIDTPQQPKDVSFVLDQLLAQSAPPIGGAIDTSRIGASGLSLGALTTLLVTFQASKRDSRIQAALALAAPSCMLTPQFFASAHVPLLLVHGDADLIVPPNENSVRAFGEAHDPRQLVLLKRGSHTAFTGVASIFDPTRNYDRLGCPVVQALPEQASFANLGPASDGINPDGSVCPPPCQATPMDPSLRADRQQELTKIMELAFFDSTLRKDGSAQRFLQTRLAAENPEVSSRLQ